MEKIDKVYKLLKDRIDGGTFALTVLGATWAESIYEKMRLNGKVEGMVLTLEWLKDIIEELRHESDVKEDTL